MRSPSHLLAVLIMLVVVVGCNGDDETSDSTEVVFDGSGCTMSGPSNLPAGGRGFVITNNSDDVSISDLKLYVASLQNGHAFQDLVDLQDEAGGSPNYYPQPSWVVHEGIAYEYFDRPEVSTPELADTQALAARMLTEGNDAVYLYATGPSRLWFCAPLEVTAQ